MTTVTPTVSGGTITSWSVSPSSRWFVDRCFHRCSSGTPTAVTSSATYTVTASNSGGSDTATLTIVVNDVVPSSLTYSPNSFTLTKGTAMTTVTPTVSGGTVTSWSVSPSLPAGLSLDSTTGAISGTPSTVTSSASYTVTASNTGGSTTATVTIVVNDVAPSSLTYSPNSFTLTKGTAMTTVTPSATGGAITLGQFRLRFHQDWPWILPRVPFQARPQRCLPLRHTRSLLPTLEEATQQQ